MHHQYEGQRGELYHRRKIAQHIVGHVTNQCRRGRQCAHAHQQRMAVGGRLGHQIGADDGPRASTIIDNHGLAQALG